MKEVKNGKKKSSPSTLNRNADRKETFLLEKKGEKSEETESPSKEMESPSN